MKPLTDLRYILASSDDFANLFSPVNVALYNLVIEYVLLYEELASWFPEVLYG